MAKVLGPVKHRVENEPIRRRRPVEAAPNLQAEPALLSTRLQTMLFVETRFIVGNEKPTRKGPLRRIGSRITDKVIARSLWNASDVRSATVAANEDPLVDKLVQYDTDTFSADFQRLGEFPFRSEPAAGSDRGAAQRGSNRLREICAVTCAEFHLEPLLFNWYRLSIDFYKAIELDTMRALRIYSMFVPPTWMDSWKVTAKDGSQPHLRAECSVLMACQLRILRPSRRDLAWNLAPTA